MKIRKPTRLREVLLQYERLWSADADTYERALSVLWDSLRQGNQDEAIGVHIGAQNSPREHVHAGLILLSQTVKHAIERIIAFYNAANPHSSYALERRGSGIVLSVHHERPAGTIRQDTEYRLALWAALPRWFDPLDRAPLAVRLRAPRPAYDGELQATFRCAVEYGQDEDAVILDEKVTATQIWGSEQAALRFEDLVELPAQAARRPQTLREHVAAAIRDGLSQGRAGIKIVAPAFGVSPRTLERQLEEEGASYRAILEEARFERCMQLLQLPGLPTRELASLLGYSNSSHFFRAFCRWFAPQPDAHGGTSRAAASGARKGLSRAELWTACYGPRPCPFFGPTCSLRCAIHPAQFNSEG